MKSGYNIWRRVYRWHENGVVGEDWCSLWNIIAPPKVKHLLWRICKDCLPTRERLQRHFVICPSTCQFCENHTEDDWHLFVGCDATNQCWEASGLSNLIASRQNLHHDLKSLIFDICRIEDNKVAGRFAVMLELLWNNRNDFIWRQEREEANKLGLCAFHRWNDWFQAQNTNNDIVSSPHVLDWKTPTNG